jgi:hypothetical protein
VQAFRTWVKQGGHARLEASEPERAGWARTCSLDTSNSAPPGRERYFKAQAWMSFCCLTLTC